MVEAKSAIFACSKMPPERRRRAETELRAGSRQLLLVAACLSFLLLSLEIKSL